MDYKQMAVINERKLRAENERLKTLLYNVCGFIIEEMLTEDITEDWSNYQFGMTAEEHKKYILGE